MDVVCSVVMLSHKYQINQLLSQALSHLTEYYTDKFDEWCKPNRITSLKPEPIDAISAINIAALTQTPSILPLAFLEVCEAVGIPNPLPVFDLSSKVFPQKPKEEKAA